MSIVAEKTNTAALVTYSIEKAEIATLANQFMPLKINGINDIGGFQAVHSARMVIKNHRVDVEKRRKELKAESLAFGRMVDEKAKEIFAALEPIESHLQAEEDAVEAEKERIRNEARLTAEAEERAKQEAEEARLKAIRDEEEAKRKAEMAAEAERLRIEREKIAEQQRIIDEERRKIEAERKAIADAAAEQQRKADAEKKRLADIEAAKQREIENERIRKETEERVKRETEARLKREAELAKEREAKKEAKRLKALALRPDKEKLLAFADAVCLVALPSVSEAAAPIAVRVRDLMVQAVAEVRRIISELE